MGGTTAHDTRAIRFDLIPIFWGSVLRVKALPSCFSTIRKDKKLIPGLAVLRYLGAKSYKEDRMTASPQTMAAAPPLLEARPLWLQNRSVSVRTARRLCETAAFAAAAAFAVPVGELLADTRRSSYVAFVRQSAMYLSHVAFGVSLSEVGRAFGRDRTTAAHACRLIEDRRDDPAIEAVLASLESACGALRRRLDAPVRP